MALRPWLPELPPVRKVECPHASTREGEATLTPMPLRPWVACYICHGAHVFVLAFHLCAMAMP